MMTRSDEQKSGKANAIRNLLIFWAVLGSAGGLVAWQYIDIEVDARDVAAVFNPVEACTARGIDYFKEIESYPYLSDGRNAERVARERCERTTTAFGGR